MQLRYPKSFFKLLSVGFLLAVLPLGAALLADTVAIGRLAAQSRQAVFDTARIAHGSRQLAESVTALERSALQGLVLRDEALWQTYRVRRQEFLDYGDHLGQLPLDGDTRNLLATLLKTEAEIDYQVTGPERRKMTTQQLSRSYAKVFTLSRQLLSYANEAIDREAEALRIRAEETESRAWRQLIVVLPAAIFLVAGFTYLLGKPIGQLEAGIRSLGEHRFEQPIHVEGPQDLEQLGERLEWLRLRLAHLEEQKSRFLRHVSHELKTPLTAVREGSNLLAEGVAGPLSTRQQEIVAILWENSMHLQRLIEGLLRHGETEFLQSKLNIQQVQPREIMQAVAEKQRIAMEARQLKLDLVAEPFTMQSDPDRLRVILDNLLSNAVKYSPEGGTIRLSALPAGSFVRFQVLDDGPGIIAADRPFVFDAFYRGQATPSGAVKSTGLGLSICRDHVEALGGTIDIGEGRGDFTVILPRGEINE